MAKACHVRGMYGALLWMWCAGFPPGGTSRHSGSHGGRGTAAFASSWIAWRSASISNRTYLAATFLATRTEGSSGAAPLERTFSYLPMRNSKCGNTPFWRGSQCGTSALPPRSCIRGHGPAGSVQMRRGRPCRASGGVSSGGGRPAILLVAVAELLERFMLLP